MYRAPVRLPAALMTAQPNLTAVDVRGNESMGLEGVRCLTDFLMGSKKIMFTHVPHSLCGVTPQRSSVEVPNELGEVEVRLICAELSSHIFAEGITAVPLTPLSR